MMKTHSLQEKLLGHIIAIMLLAMSVTAATERPNILFIFSDDHSYRTISAYPGAYPYANTPHIDRLAHNGVSFENAYVGARCAPSRASILTGRLQINVENNTTRYWPQDFRAAGYTTAMIGKWHWKKGAEFHQHGVAWDWSVVWDHGQPEEATTYYTGQHVMIDGADPVALGGYSTDRYTDYTVQFIEEQEGAEKPWFMWLCYGAVHGPYTPADRHVGSLTEAEQTPIPVDIYGPRPGKPDYINTFTRWSDQGGVPYSDTQPFDLAVKQYTEAVMAIDEGVDRIFTALQESGQLDNTIIIFTSDQGFAWGQHGLKDKRFPYEAALRSPLIFYAPGRFPTNSWCNYPVNGPDIVRTLHALAEVEPVIPLDGRDFSQLLVQPDHDDSWSEVPMVQMFTEGVYGSELIEQALENEDWNSLEWKKSPPSNNPYWIMTHDGRYKYTRYMAENHMEELYDLQTDPEELTNLAFNAELSTKLVELRAQTVDGFRAIGADFVDLLPEPGPLPSPAPPLPPKDTYRLLEDFELRTLGAPISGQGDWTGDMASSNEVVVSQDPEDSSNQVLFFNQGENDKVFLNASALRMTNDTVGTLFFRMRGVLAEPGGSNLLVQTALIDQVSDSQTDTASDASEVSVDFESISTAAEAELSAGTVGGSWTLNLDRGAVYTIEPDNGGANDLAFLADDSNGGNAGDIFFSTITFANPVEVASAIDRSLAMTFETGVSRKNVNKHPMYIINDGSAGEAIRIIWQNDGSLVVNGTTVGTVATLADAQMLSGSWDSTSAKVQNIHIVFGQTTWDLDWNGMVVSGLSYAPGFDGTIGDFSLYSEGSSDPGSRGVYLNDMIMGESQMVASGEPRLLLDPAEGIALEVTSQNAFATGTLDVAFRYGVAKTDVEITTVSVIDQQHAGAFRVSDFSFPLVLNDPFPSTEMFGVEFDGVVAGLGEGEISTGVVEIIWNEIGGSTYTNQLPVQASFVSFGEGEVAMDLACDGSSNMTFMGTVLSESKWHDVWCVVDNTADTFSTYIRPDGADQFPIAFNEDFLNGNTTNDLVMLMLKSPGDPGSDGDAWFDDFYILHGLDARHMDPTAPPSALLLPIADAFVADGYPVPANTGDATVLETKAGVAGYNRHTYLKFDVSGMTDPISRALLWLKVQSIDTPSTTHQIYFVEDDTWTESGIVWTNTPEQGTVQDSVSLSGTGEWIAFDITSHLEAERAADGLLSLVITDAGGNGCYSAYHSREAASPDDRPLVEIYSEVAEGVNPFTLRTLWASSWGQDIGALTHDFDADGVNNLYEYGWGGNPTNPQVKGFLPTFGSFGTNLVYVYAKRINDSSLVYYLESTDDLMDGVWSNAGYQVMSTDFGDGEFGSVTNRISLDQQQLFIRPVLK